MLTRDFAIGVEDRPVCAWIPADDRHALAQHVRGKRLDRVFFEIQAEQKHHALRRSRSSLASIIGEGVTRVSSRAAGRSPMSSG